MGSDAACVEVVKNKTAFNGAIYNDVSTDLIFKSTAAKQIIWKDASIFNRLCSSNFRSNLSLTNSSNTNDLISMIIVSNGFTSLSNFGPYNGKVIIYGLFYSSAINIEINNIAGASLIINGGKTLNNMQLSVGTSNMQHILVTVNNGQIRSYDTAQANIKLRVIPVDF